MTEPPSRGVRDRLRRSAGAVVVVAYAGLVATVRPFTWPALAVVAIPAVVVLGLAARRPPDAHPRSRAARGIALWAILTGAVVAWQLLAYFQSPRDAHPTISSILDAAGTNRPVRAALFLGWIAFGRELARR